MPKRKLPYNPNFYDSLASLVKPVVDNTSKRIVAPVQRYDGSTKKITPVYKASARNLTPTYTSSGGKTPAKYIAPTTTEINQKAAVRRQSEQQSAIDELKQRQMFHDNNPVSKLLGTNKALPSSIKPTTPELLQGMARGIENFYKIPQLGILNDFVNPLHMASDGIIAPWADAPQNTLDINNYYKDNPGAPNIMFGKNIDPFLPTGMAALSTAITAPFIKGSPAMIKAGIDLPKTIGRSYRDLKFAPNVIEKNGVTYKNSHDFLKNNTFDKGLNKNEINFLNKEIEARGILEEQRRHPFDVRSELSKRTIVPENYNIREVVGNAIPNLLRGKKAISDKYTMGQMRENAFNQYLGIPTKNSAYRVHSSSFKNGEGLNYTMPERLINRSSSKEQLYPFNNAEFEGMQRLENYARNPTQPNALSVEAWYGSEPKSLLANKDFEYGNPLIKGDKTVFPGWDYITGTGGGAPFIKEGNKVMMKDVWDIQPFSRNTRLPKFIRNFNANKILGGKDFTLKQTYTNGLKGIRQTIKKGGNYAY